MKVEVTQLLSDIKFFKENISEIRFMKNDGAWHTSFPSIASWAQGDIVLQVKPVGSYAHVVGGLKNRLANYGVDATCVSVGAAVENALKFKARAGDDIIVILAKALADQKLQAKVGELSNQLSGLNQNVDQLVEQLPHVRHGAFSRGVNAMKNQVAVLQNIRQKQR